MVMLMVGAEFESGERTDPRILTPPIRVARRFKGTNRQVAREALVVYILALGPLVYYVCSPRNWKLLLNKEQLFTSETWVIPENPLHNTGNQVVENHRLAKTPDVGRPRCGHELQPQSRHINPRKHRETWLGSDSSPATLRPRIPGALAGVAWRPGELLGSPRHQSRRKEAGTLAQLLWHRNLQTGQMPGEPEGPAPDALYGDYGRPHQAPHPRTIQDETALRVLGADTEAGGIHGGIHHGSPVDGNSMLEFSNFDSTLVEQFVFGLTDEATKNKLLVKDAWTLNAALTEVAAMEQGFGRDPDRKRCVGLSV